MKARPILLLVALILLSFAKSNGGVNPKNGNFYISYTDFVFSNSAMKLNIARTYNSKIADAGWFGIGWGSDYETYLITVPGGGLLIFNNGSGKRDIQKPKEWDMQDISLAIDELVEAMKTEGKLKTPDEVTSMKSKLQNDQELRHTFWRRYLRKGMVRNRVVTPGTKLYSSCGCGGFEFIVATADGFKRSNSNGNTEYFNLSGKLIKIEDAGGNNLQFEYNDSLYIKSIRDNNGNTLMIETNENGRITRITDQKERFARYEYDKNNNLVYSQDIGGNVYRHEYDGNSNMTAILYMDGLRMTIEYNKSGFATRVTGRDTTSTEYQYPGLSASEYGSVIIKRDKKDSVTWKESVWYSLKTDAIGTSWVGRIAKVTNDSDSVIQIFNEAHHRIDTLLRGKEFFSFFYDNKGNLLKVCESGGNCVTPEIEQNKLTSLNTPPGIFRIIYDENNKPVTVTDPSGARFDCPVNTETAPASPLLKEFFRWLDVLSYTYFSDRIDAIIKRP